MSTRNTLRTVRMTTAADAKPHGLRAQHHADRQQRHAEGEPHRRIGVLLGVGGGAAVSTAPWIERPHLERQIGERERDRGHGRGRRCSAAAARRATTQREHRRQHRRQAVAEQDQIEEGAADRLAGDQRDCRPCRARTRSPQASAPRSTSAPTSWTTLRVRRRSRSSPMVIASPTQTCSAISARLDDRGRCRRR